MNLVGNNNDIIAICSNEHNIYLIDIGEKIENNNNNNNSNDELKKYFERYSGNYENWFEKHSSKNKNDNLGINNNEVNKKDDNEEKNLNYNDNNKQVNYEDWFKKHSKGKINDESGKKYNVINCRMNECENNFVSVLKCYGDFLLLLDNTNKIIFCKIEKIGENIDKLRFIEEFEFHDIICFTPFGFYLQS